MQLRAGVNTFVVKYPSVLGEEYPDHVKAATFFGRVINDQHIVNLDVAMKHSDKVGGLPVG